MKIIHISDTHGRFPYLPDGDVVVHTGDFLPNKTRGRRSAEVPFQTQWLKNNKSTIEYWLDGRPFIYGMGNHDYITNVCEILNENSTIKSFDMNMKHVNFQGVRFYHFPFIPYIAGEWNYEVTVDLMQREMRRLKDEIQLGVDVLCTHAPPYGILDNNLVVRFDGKSSPYGDSCGNTLLTNYLTYELSEIDDNNRPKYLFCGHIHENHGFASEFDLIISNAATTVHVIEYPI